MLADLPLIFLSHLLKNPLITTKLLGYLFKVVMIVLSGKTSDDIRTVGRALSKIQC